MRVAAALILTAAAAAAWSAMVWTTGGFSADVAGLHISARDAWRPLALAGLAAIGAIAIPGMGAARNALARLIAFITPRRAAGMLAIAVVAAGLGWNSWTASGADSFAYISQAALWRAGQLQIPVTLAPDAPWPEHVRTFAPFGYRPAPAGTPQLVPITAPGVPIAMAVLQRIGGYRLAFLVTPIAGGLLVLCTFGIGRRVHSDRAGAIAALLVASSPALLYMLMWPMSDVPAAACAAAMTWLVLAGTPRTSLLAGLAAAVGMLTRTNLVTIAAAALVWLAFRNRRHALLFVAGLAPGAFVIAALNVHWFGAVLASGYGSAEHLLAISRVPVNAWRFALWLLETSPVIWIGVAEMTSGVVFFTSRRKILPTSSSAMTLFLLTAAGAVSVYLLYDTHEEWWYLRFLLPAWPALFVPAAVALTELAGRNRASAVAAAAIIVLSTAGGVVVARERGVFSVGEGERRYVSVARLVDQATEPDAVIITSQHAGTVWFYANRTTIRYDVLDPLWLDRAVRWLADRGRHPYILLEDWEHPLFEARFKSANRMGDLSYSPMVAWQSTRIDGWTWLYDPLDPRRATAQPGASLELNQPRCALPKRSILCQ